MRNLVNRTYYLRRRLLLMPKIIASGNVVVLFAAVMIARASKITAAAMSLLPSFGPRDFFGRQSRVNYWALFLGWGIRVLRPADRRISKTPAAT